MGESRDTADSSQYKRRLQLSGGRLGNTVFAGAAEFASVAEWARRTADGVLTYQMLGIEVLGNLAIPIVPIHLGEMTFWVAVPSQICPCWFFM